MNGKHVSNSKLNDCSPNKSEASENRPGTIIIKLSPSAITMAATNVDTSTF